MKKILFTAVILLFIGLAIPFLQAADTYPTGKNLFNPNVFYVNENGMYTYRDIPVVGDQRYVFSMPARSNVGEMHIQISDGTNVFVNELNTGGSMCHEEGNILVCLFQTDDDTESLSFQLTAHQSAFAMYFDLSGFSNFQLEEGDTYTGYEAYQGALNDSIPVIQGDGNLYTSYETKLEMEQIIGTYITAYDDVDGDLTEAIVILEDNYTGNEQVVGSYSVELSVSDSSMNTALFTLHIYVQDEVAPVISGPDYFEVDVDQQPSIEDIVDAYLTLYDDYDGVIETFDIITDTYSNHKDTLGEHDVKIQIEDSSSNATTHSFTVDVKDYHPPIIHGRDSTTLLQSEENILEDILLGLYATDNHTPDEAIDFGIASHNLPECLDIPGEYEVVLEAIDASGNRTTKAHEVVIYDDIPPVIEGPLTYEISYTESTTAEALKQLLTVYDNYEALTLDDLYIVENSYKNHEDAIGIYRIIFAVEDQNNITEHTIYIQVVDDVPPVFEVTPRIIIETGSTIPEEDILQLLMQDEDVSTFNPVSLTILDISESDDDFYTYIVELKNDNNEILEKSLEVIHISEQIDSKDDVTEYWVIGILGITALMTIVLIKRKY